MDELLGMTIPRNTQAEMAVIGSLLVDPRCARSVIKELLADDFYSKVNRDAYEVMQTMYAAGEPIDPITVMGKINERGVYDENIEQYLADAMKLTPTAANAAEYARIVKETAALRRIKEKASEAIVSGENSAELANALIKICRDNLSGGSGKMRSMLELMNESADTLFNGAEPKKIDTGFQRLDALLMGLRPGNLVILAARPGVGKSAFAQDIAENVAKKGKKIVIYSMEMKGDELSERWIAKTSGVEMDSILKRKFEESEIKKISDSFEYLSALPISVCDEANVSPDRVRRDMMNMDGVEMVIVDYVGLMEANDRKKGFESRNLELGAISRELKKLAVELDIPILMLCQLNREIDDKQQPGLRHLRDSGELEQNANKVIFLWNIDEDSQTVGVSVAKNRQGRKGIVQMHFDSAHMRFTEMEYDMDLPEAKERRRRRWDNVED